MKIVIYGVSRSGKDYTITAVVDYINRQQPNRAYHLKGSETLKRLSESHFGMSLEQCSEEEKHMLRLAFIDVLNMKAKQYEVVFVDGHYAFMSDNGEFNVVLTDEDKASYDAFFYLDPPSSRVVQYARSSTGSKHNPAITEEEVRRWKWFERYQLGEMCLQLDKELMVLDGDIEPSIDFICRFIADHDGEQFNPQIIARRLVENFPELELYQQVILLDCDKTTSVVDLSGEHAERCGIRREHLKEIFRNDRYSAYQFDRVADLYKRCAEHIQIDVASIVSCNPRLSKWLLDIVREQAPKGFVLGITAGEQNLWQQILQKHSPFDNLIAHNQLEVGNSYITPAVKRAVALELRSRGKSVIAFGDSLIDIPMLEAANRGYLVAHTKLNQPVLAHLTLRGDTLIRQFSGKYLYPNITIDSTHSYQGII